MPKVNRLMTLYTLVITSISFLIFTNVEAAEPFGAYLGEFNGVPAYSNCNFSCTTCNNYCHSYNYIDGVYIGRKWQCVEYVRRYYLLRYGLDLASRYSGDARTWYDHAIIMGLNRYHNGGSTAPQVGDILVSNYGNSFHVAIVRSVSNNQVCTIQQNFSNTRTDVNRCLRLTILNGHYTLYGFKKFIVKGWLRSQSLVTVTNPLLQ